MYNPATIISRLASFLNQYANLLLALITLIYVLLTWRGLGEARQASLREREARHLQEIKDNVIQPILDWINGTVLDRFTGKSPELLRVSGGYEGQPRQLCHTVDDPFRARQPLGAASDSVELNPLAPWESTESGRIPKVLYDEAKRDHFADELREFDRLLDEVTQLAGTFVSIANKCGKDISDSGILPVVPPENENATAEWGKPYLLAAECIESFLLGRNDPKTWIQTVPPFSSLLNAKNEALAKAEQRQQDKLNRWRDFGLEKVRTRWQSDDLQSRVKTVLKDAHSVRGRIDGLRFTHSLVDCELVSGKKPRHWLGTWHPFKKPPKTS